MYYIMYNQENSKNKRKKNQDRKEGFENRSNNQLLPSDLNTTLYNTENVDSASPFPTVPRQGDSMQIPKQMEQMFAAPKESNNPETLQNIFPNPTNKKLDISTVNDVNNYSNIDENCNYNNDNTGVYQDNYFKRDWPTDQNKQNINNSSPDGNSFTSLTGENVDPTNLQHNNMQPFFGSKVTGNIYSEHSDALLDSKTGSGTFNVKKQEMAPLFKPEKNMSYGSGTPNQCDFIKSRMNPSMTMNCIKPWDEKRVATGLNKGFTCEGGNGCNDTMDERNMDAKGC